MHRIVSFTLLLIFFSFTVKAQDSLSVEIEAESIEELADSVSAEMDVNDTTEERIDPSTLAVKYPMDSAQFQALLDEGKLKEEAEPLKMVDYAMKIVDKETNAPIRATVELFTLTDQDKGYKGIGYTDDDGIFQLNLAANYDYKLTISARGFMPETKTFSLKADSEDYREEVRKRYKLTRLDIGSSINLENIQFEQGSSELTKDSYSQLNQLVSLLESNPGMEIELEGHTDRTASPAASLRLSEERVESVKEYIVNKGIKDKRIKGVGYGDSKPIYKGPDKELQKLNRRVDFRIIKM